MPMPRLLLVLNDPIDLHANRLGLVRAARAAGWDVHVAAPPEQPAAARIAADGWPFHPIALVRLGLSPRRELAAAASLAALYRRLRPDVVHLRAVKPILAGGLAAWTCPRAGVLSHWCGLGWLVSGRGARAAALRAAAWPALRVALHLPRQRVVAQNADDAHALQRLGLIAASRVRLIPGSGIDAERFRPAPAPAGPPVAVLPARLLRAKGLVEFAEAGRILARQGSPLRLRVVGPDADGNPDAVPAAQVRAWAAEGCLSWDGPSDDMPAVYAASAMVCLPSWREGFPKALLEGAACGLPLVACDVPGSRAAVQHGVTGLLVPPRDPAALAAALAQLADDPARCARLGAAARQRALAEFAEARIAASFLDLYQELHQQARA
jgi:glycosyltransferase involved in cell wall biosynthesis